MLEILETRRAPRYPADMVILVNELYNMNHSYFKHSQERKQHAEIEQLKVDWYELNKDYTAMSAEVQKNDKGFQ